MQVEDKFHIFAGWLKNRHQQFLSLMVNNFITSLEHSITDGQHFRS